MGRLLKKLNDVNSTLIGTLIQLNASLKSQWIISSIKFIYHIWAMAPITCVPFPFREKKGKIEPGQLFRDRIDLFVCLFVCFF